MTLHKKFQDSELDDKFIPKGIYCHGIGYGKIYDKESPKVRYVGDCLYWDFDDEKPKQQNGYCHFMKKGDWELSGGLLWDHCKECGINDKLEEDEIPIK